MQLQIQLRPGVVFRADADREGSIEFAGGRRFENVSFKGMVPGRTDTGKPAQVKVFCAAYPTSDEQITRREHLPALAAVAVETHYLRADRAILACVFYLPFFVDAGGDLDPRRTVVLTMHGGVEVDDNDDMKAGSPSLSSVNPNQWIFLGPAAVAALVQWVRGPGGERPNALVNTGCFSSTRQKQGGTFNEELAALLAEQGGMTVYGPPHAGIVTTAMAFGEWSKVFGQHVADEIAIHEVPIKFQRIVPAAARPIERPKRRKAPLSGRGKPVPHASVVVTNDYALAAEIASFSPDFSEARPHTFDRALME
jgi:hypothetical protein